MAILLLHQLPQVRMLFPDNWFVRFLWYNLAVSKKNIFLLKTGFLEKGALAVSSILIIGIVIFETAAAALFISYLASQGGLGAKILGLVNFAALSGVDDAVRRIIHNDFSSSASYNLTVNNITTQVTVCKNLTYTGGTDCGSPALTDRYDVSSLATYLNKNKKYRSVVYVNPINSQVIIESIKEVTTQ